MRRSKWRMSGFGALFGPRAMSDLRCAGSAWLRKGVCKYLAARARTLKLEASRLATICDQVLTIRDLRVACCHASRRSRRSLLSMRLLCFNKLDLILRRLRSGPSRRIGLQPRFVIPGTSMGSGRSPHSTARDAPPYLNPGQTADKVLRHRRPQTGGV
jgi:hypothetical protein